MPEALVSPVDCCYPCPDQRSVTIPGPQGDPGTPGTDGTDGINAFTQLADSFTMPTYSATDTATVDEASWMSVGEPIWIEGLGVLKVTNIAGNVVTLQNLDDNAGAYDDNAAPGTVAASTSYVTPTGWQGPPGQDGTSGAPTTAKYILKETDGSLGAAQSLGALTTGLLKNTVAASVGTLSKAVDGTDYLSPATGLMPADIGATVQGYDALLEAIKTLGITANKIIYGTGVDTVALTDLTTFMRGLLGSASATVARTSLGVLSRKGLLGGLIGADMNVTTDQAITMASTKYHITSILVTNASINLTTAQGGVYNAVGKPGGGVIVAAGQVYTALSASSKYVELTLAGVALTNIQTAGFVYLSLSTPQGAAATADVYIFGEDLS